MATELETDVQCTGQFIPQTKRKLQKQLRSSGLSYVSRTGKIIPAKQVAEEFCQCPQKCNERVNREHRENLFKYFYYYLGDADAQNYFLRAHMDVRARPQSSLVEVPRLPGSRPPRRITCKYLIPKLDDSITHPSSLFGDRSRTIEICQKAFCNAFVISTKRVRLQREKLIHSMGLNSYHHQRNQKRPNATKLSKSTETIAMVFDKVTETVTDVAAVAADAEAEVEINRVNNDQVKFIEDVDIHKLELDQKKSFVNDPLIPMGISVPEGVTIAPVVATPDHDRDIAIVNNFFYHQLWKPEYIGTYS